ncbi:hypothetical protein Clacol_004607 [Clathrus columnatus]|uniref:Uncharacterized protein n=1 Tax=Clathrus columnatus TaxID=1419009 RepID=A0AAV5A6X7_9AGAM|nr:hypothetical protein Clacol_004607 [Clathrus columnatus]
MSINKDGCRLYEIEQFICDYKENEPAKCYPLPRIFYECPNRPVIEVTSLVSIDPATGELDVPDNLNNLLPEGKQWTEIRK